ncbi:MAG: class I SAM-dependent methyltransferase [Ignavibacteria bacterium]|nr:class I SAM-dependent methyltransferase [Ignavibacteria bacterium]
MSIYNEKISKCYFCNSENLIPHSKAKYWNYADINYEECNHCGLIFANPMLSLDTITKGNTALNILHKSRGTFSQYKGGKEFSFYLKKIKKSGVLLDVGCAEGFFLKGIKDYSDWNVEGIEIIDSIVKFSNDVLDIRVYLSTLESFETDKKYDFIRMNNVIEHCLNPIEFLQKAYYILEKKGFVWCSTPNGYQDGALLKRANKQGIMLNLLENHLFLYKPKTLIKMFEKVGFKIIKSYCENIKHSITDFGVIPFLKVKDANEKFSLVDFEGKCNVEFYFTKSDLQEFRKNPALKSYKLKFNLFLKKFVPVKIPWGIPIGHQQFILAQKT